MSAPEVIENGLLEDEPGHEVRKKLNTFISIAGSLLHTW